MFCFELTDINIEIEACLTMSDGEKELFKAITDSLQEKGVLGDLSAVVQAHVLHILKQEEPTKAKNILGSSDF